VMCARQSDSVTGVNKRDERLTPTGKHTDNIQWEPEMPIAKMTNERGVEIIVNTDWIAYALPATEGSTDLHFAVNEKSGSSTTIRVNERLDRVHGLMNGRYT
jgi:hypothetical protein